MKSPLIWHKVKYSTDDGVQHICEYTNEKSADVHAAYLGLCGIPFKRTASIRLTSQSRGSQLLQNLVGMLR